MSAGRMTQPHFMKNAELLCGEDRVSGNEAWSLFKAAASDDITGAKALLKKNPRLVNVELWYQLPLHFAVWSGSAEMVRLLLDANSNPGHSTFLYYDWARLLDDAQLRGYSRIESLLLREMKRRFNFSSEIEKLSEAINARAARKVMSIIKRRPHLLRKADARGNTALHSSVRTRQLRLIKRLIDAGSPIDARNAAGSTPLQLALSWFRPFPLPEAVRNRWVVVGTLLACGARYTLSAAAAVGDQERVEEHLRKDAGLARRLDSSRVNPLSYAAREGHSHIVKLLLDHGADPNQPESAAPDGAALFYACWGNHLDTVRVLLEHGANPNAGLDSCGCCLTIGKHSHGTAAKPVSELLRQYGAFDPPYDMTTKELKQAIQAGSPVLQHEEFSGNILDRNNAELLELYLDSDPTIVERLQAACGIICPQSPRLVRMLLERGLTPNLPDWRGKTYLHDCAERLDVSNARLFLKAGADVNARDIQFKGTALASAARVMPESADLTPLFEQKRERMVKLLLKHGAVTSFPDDEPWATPIAWAQRNGLSSITAMLQQHGKDN